MRVVKSVRIMRRLICQTRQNKKRIGFVPTMGALHEGHLSLIRKSRRENDINILSIFVNPKQFGPHEDFRRYPRQTRKDNLLAKKEKVDIIFCPSEKEMYPSGYLTHVHVEQMTEPLCGKFRPGHFRGVTTVVAKLLNIVQPDVLYLGQKDAQQAVVLKRMIEDLNFPIKVKICPTVRENDGLAMSSRNRHLTPRQRKEAAILFQSLKNARNKILSGERHPQAIIKMMKTQIRRFSSAQIDYADCVQASSLNPIEHIQGRILIALAVRFGRTRLIDNIVLKV